MKRIPVAGLLVTAMACALAQQKFGADGIAEYRKMLEDGNPSDLFEARGEELWKKNRGPKNASLEQCDLGKGPGVVKGAFVELPRYFADTKKVQDLESRLLTCRNTGPRRRDAKTPFGFGEQVSIKAWSPMSRRVQQSLNRRAPRRTEDVRAQRKPPYDFSCASCHGEAGKDPMQELPVDFRSRRRRRLRRVACTLEQRRDGHAASPERCYRQQRFLPGYGPMTIALGVCMGVNAKAQSTACHQALTLRPHPRPAALFISSYSTACATPVTLPDYAPRWPR
jgi:sulfur-oxidizing protein SoxA